MEFKPEELAQWIPEAGGDIKIPQGALNVASQSISAKLRTVGQSNKHGAERE
jgi:hypothetical protein